MKRLLILSGKGGTGKTTTAASLAYLAQAQAIADCDVDAPNLHLIYQTEEVPKASAFFGGEKASVLSRLCNGCDACIAHCRFGAVSVAEGCITINEYACEGCGVCAYVCPQGAIELHTDIAGEKRLYTQKRVFSTATLKMGRGNSGKLVTEVKLAMIKNAPKAPLAVIDGSPGIGCPVVASMSGMDLVLVVAEPSDSGISDLKRLLTTIEHFQATAAVCVNKWDIAKTHTQDIEALCQQRGIAFVGKIPYDSHVSAAMNVGKCPVETDGPAGAALKEIYKSLIELLEL